MVKIVIALIFIGVLSWAFNGWMKTVDTTKTVQTHEMARDMLVEMGQDPNKIPPLTEEKIAKEVKERQEERENGVKYDPLKTLPGIGHTTDVHAKTRTAADTVGTEPPSLLPPPAIPGANQPDLSNISGKRATMPHPEYIGLEYQYTDSVDPMKELRPSEPVRHWYKIKQDTDMNFISVVGIKPDSLKIFTRGPAIWEYAISQDGTGRKLIRLKYKLTADSKQAQLWDDGKKAWGEIKPFNVMDIKQIVQLRILRDKEDEYPVDAEFGWLP